MPSVKVYNQQGSVTGDIALNDAHFGVRVNPGLIHEVVLAQAANARHPIAHAKTRGEVRGGGKKPWKQKGTGRARQGSIRSPQWVGGGIVFGPRNERNFSVKVNRKARQKALFMALSDKVANTQFMVLESFTAAELKTKQAAKLFAALPRFRSTLVVLPASDPNFVRMVRNLPNVMAVTANSLNLQDVLHYQGIIFWKDAIPAFETLFSNAS